MSIRNLRNYLTILGNQPDYEPLFDQVKQLIEIQNQLLKMLPSSIRNRCAVGKYAGGEILIYADNGVVASRLRQLIPVILRDFNREGEAVDEIRIAVQPDSNRNLLADSRKRVRQLNPSATRHLNDLIATLPNESILRKSLVKLLSHNSQ